MCGCRFVIIGVYKQTILWYNCVLLSTYVWCYWLSKMISHSYKSTETITSITSLKPIKIDIETTTTNTRTSHTPSPLIQKNEIFVFYLEVWEDISLILGNRQTSGDSFARRSIAMADERSKKAFYCQFGNAFQGHQPTIWTYYRIFTRKFPFSNTAYERYLVHIINKFTYL